MRNKITLILLVLIIFFTIFSVIKLGVQIYEKELELLNERMDLLEKMILNNKTIDSLNSKLDEAAVVLNEYDSLDQAWIEWIGQNMWIVEVDWGE